MEGKVAQTAAARCKCLAWSECKRGFPMADWTGLLQWCSVPAKGRQLAATALQRPVMNGVSFARRWPWCACTYQPLPSRCRFRAWLMQLTGAQAVLRPGRHAQLLEATANSGPGQHDGSRDCNKRANDETLDAKRIKYTAHESMSSPRWLLHVTLSISRLRMPATRASGSARPARSASIRILGRLLSHRNSPAQHAQPLFPLHFPI